MTTSIVILTKDRAAYLNWTLRSLSATDLPAGISVTVYDDASTDAVTLDYYTSSGTVTLQQPKWPADDVWRKYGLSILSNAPVVTKSLLHTVEIIRHTKSSGVVKASCNALCAEFDKGASGVILLQDDVLFKTDWYTRIHHTLDRSRTFTDKTVGILAGIKLNTGLSVKPGTPAVVSGITAQCIYVAKAAYERTSFIKNPPNTRKRFDDLLYRSITNAGLWGGVIYPFVCQHIGIKSLVRPNRKWSSRNGARVGYHVAPPYAMSTEVKVFK
jgi:hypothetical protein